MFIHNNWRIAETQNVKSESSIQICSHALDQLSDQNCPITVVYVLVVLAIHTVISKKGPQFALQQYRHVASTAVPWRRQTDFQILYSATRLLNAEQVKWQTLARPCYLRATLCIYSMFFFCLFILTFFLLLAFIATSGSNRVDVGRAVYLVPFVLYLWLEAVN